MDLDFTRARSVSSKGGATRHRAEGTLSLARVRVTLNAHSRRSEPDGSVYCRCHMSWTVDLEAPPGDLDSFITEARKAAPPGADVSFNRWLDGSEGAGVMDQDGNALSMSVRLSDEGMVTRLTGMESEAAAERVLSALEEWVSGEAKKRGFFIQKATDDPSEWRSRMEVSELSSAAPDKNRGAAGSL